MIGIGKTSTADSSAIKSFSETSLKTSAGESSVSSKKKSLKKKRRSDKQSKKSSSSKVRSASPSKKSVLVFTKHNVSLKILNKFCLFFGFHSNGISLASSHS